MEEETLKIAIYMADKATQRVIFSAQKSDDLKPFFGVATCDTETATGPMWQLVMPKWPTLTESTKKALEEPRFQDFFSLLFMMYHEFGYGMLYVYNDCGAVSFSIKPE